MTQEKEEPNVCKNLEIKANEFYCIKCNLQFKTNLDRLDHNKTKHIHDNWPDSGSKRDLSMIKTSSISEPKKKKTAYELEMKERSDHMDSKILEKKKKDEMEDISNKKLIEEKKRQQEIKESLDKKKKKYQENIQRKSA